VVIDELLLDAKLSVPPPRSGAVSRSGLIETAEAVGTADLLCSALEAAVVVLLVVTMRRPQVQESAAPTKAQRRMVAVGAVAAAAVTVAALAASPPVFGHAHHPHGVHSALR
jgi:hypothetical protein